MSLTASSSFAGYRALFFGETSAEAEGGFLTALLANGWARAVVACWLSPRRLLGAV